MSGGHKKLLRIIVVIIWIGTIFAYLGWWSGFNTTVLGTWCMRISVLCNLVASILIIVYGRARGLWWG